MLGFTSVSVFLFSSLALAFNSGYSLGALLLLLGSAALLWQRPALRLGRPDYLLLGALALYFAVHALSNYFHGDPGRDYDPPLRALLAIPVMLLLRAYPPRPGAWWGGVALGAIGGAVLGGWQFFAQGMERPQAATSNAIHYGNISMLLGVFCLAGLCWAVRVPAPRRRAWLILLGVGCCAGVFGSVISGSRGGWLALPLCALLVWWQYGHHFSRRHVGVGALLLVALLAILAALPRSPIRERAEVAVTDLQQFADSGNVETSIGQRVEMWRSAVRLSAERPWLGWGRLQYMARKVEMVKEGTMTAAVVNTTNAHNDYLDAQVKHGLPGLAALLALFLVPLAGFASAWRAARASHAATGPYALAGMMLCLCYILFGLTTTSLTLNIGITMLVFPMVMLWSLARPRPPAP